MDKTMLKNIVAKFDISAPVTDIMPLGEGLINDTYLVTTQGDSTPDYVLQRINHHVFTDVAMLMDNIGTVTDHLRQKLRQQGEQDLRHHVLQFVPLNDHPGKLFTESEGNFWRMMIYIEHAVTKQEVNVENSHAAGIAFGRFQAMLADLPCQLGETIKDFHNMEFRLQQLRQAVSDDCAGRVGTSEVQHLLHEIDRRSEEMVQGEILYRQGLLPKRVCHCDTKVNNMMFSEDGTEVLCVIDLDTVMPSLIFSDYGDFLRTAANTAAEDEQDLSKVAFRMDIFRAFTEGYLSEARAFLTDREIAMLPLAVKMFPFMQCVRFLWDFLCGDKYWKVSYPQHNLVRSQNQLRLLECIEASENEITHYIKQQIS